MKYLHRICLAAVMTAVLAMLCGCSAADYTLPAQVDMQPGESIALARLVHYTGPENEQATAEDATALLEKLGSVENINFSFASSVPGIVSVDEEGVMTAGLTGDATVIVRCNALDYYAEVRVSVRNLPQSLAVEPVASLTPGDSYTLNAEVRPGKKYAQLQYTSADESIATVDETGMITAVATGETAVTAQVVGSSLTAMCRVVVTQEDEMMQGITISRGDAAMTAGETLLLSAASYPESNVDMIWRSSDESVATVDETGMVTAMAAGAAAISATVRDQTAICTVTVEAKATGESATPEDAAAISNDMEEEAGIFTAETWADTEEQTTPETATPEMTTAESTDVPETVPDEPATSESPATDETAATAETATGESAAEDENAALEAPSTPETATTADPATESEITNDEADTATPETAVGDEMDTIDLDVFFEQTPESATAGSATHDEEDAAPQSNRGWPHLPNGMPLGPGPVIPQQTPETADPATTPETAQTGEPAEDVMAVPSDPQTPETATAEAAATPETATPETASGSVAEEAVRSVQEWVEKVVEGLLE